MNESRTSLTNYVAYLVQSPLQEAPQMKNTLHTNKQRDIEEQKTFTELRPANNLGKLHGNQDNATNGITRDRIDNTPASSNINNATIINWKQNQSSNQCFPFSKSFPSLESNDDFVDEVIEQQQVGCNGNTLAMENIVLYDFGNTVGEVIECDSKNSFQCLVSGNNNIQNGHIDFTLHDGAALTDEEFKFPACVEEQYKEMMGLLTTKKETALPNIETVFSRPISLQEFNNSNNKSQYTITDNNTVDCKNAMENGLSNIQGNKNTNKFVNLKQIDPRMYEAKEVEADEYETVVSTDSSVNNDNEDVEKILSLINPDADIMGKTFHKIPSTQPIYSDNDTRQSENDEENRIRRPMNAFMLWARKYRSLVAKEFADASNSEISVKLGEIWNELSSELQKPYFRKAESLKAEHKLNYPNYIYQPRQSKPKQSKRNKDYKDRWIAMSRENRALQNITEQSTSTTELQRTTDYIRSINGCRKPNISGVHDIGHVASTVVLSQNGTEVDLVRHVRNQQQIMAPKPVYPTRMQQCKEEEGDHATEDCDAATQLLRTSVSDRSLGTDEDDRERQTRMTEQSFCRHNELGLLKDAMLPSMDKNGDECDLVNAMYTGLDVADLDAYLAGVNSEFGDYLETHYLSDNNNNSSKTVCSKVVKRKHNSTKLQNKMRKKIRA